MQKIIVITDLTTMVGDRICIAGIDQHNKCIRPVLPPPGVLRKHLYIRKRIIFEKLAIHPRAKIKFDFHRVSIKPPHIEDLGFDPNSIVYEGLCTDANWEQVLQDSSFSTVDDIYDGLLKEYRWVEPGANTRSIGTLSQARITAVKLPEWSGKLKYKLFFRDHTGFPYDNIPVSDLAFREFSYTEVKKRNRSPETVAQEITSLIKNADRLYLRL